MRTWPAASAHLITALGAGAALLAAVAMIERDWRAFFAWLAVALLIDGIDGPLARRWDVHTNVPRFSGERLDLVIDYVTYVFLPALALYLAGYLSGAWGLLLAVAVAMSSLYHFADLASKTVDHHFVGFPAIWNAVAFYCFAFDWPRWGVVALVLVCVALTFVPWKWVHPVRVREGRGLTALVGLAWCIAALATIATGFPAAPAAKVVLAAGGLYALGLIAREHWKEHRGAR